MTPTVVRHALKVAVVSKGFCVKRNGADRVERAMALGSRWCRGGSAWLLSE